MDPKSLPTMHDLPSEDPEESGLPDEFHGLQPQLLAESLSLKNYSRSEIFSAFDLNIYYDPKHTGWYKRPDWFLVVGGSRLYQGQTSRSSYVMWDEKIAPVVVVEFLSPGTEADDLGPFAEKPMRDRAGKPPGKFTVYEQILRVPNYIIFDAETLQLRYFRLVNGRYQEQTVSPMNPRLWVPELNLGLGLWRGEYRDLPHGWLRWCDDQGNWIPTEVETERSAKERERAERQKLAAYLRSIGIDPENLPPV
ncbi:MAG: Uma2 family endonuclease [Alkalinema sp. RU_4_3]|nr:Uma2 family endonuclease [Alkalinema sp. RU_4_3]